jgi:hypothetical protein
VTSPRPRQGPPLLTAGQLAEQLLRNSGAVVQVALPRELFVPDGSMHLPTAAARTPGALSSF